MRDKLEQRSFLFMLMLVTLLFGIVLEPFWGAIFWSCAISVIFYPLQQRLSLRLGHRPNTASLLTLLVSVVIVVLPVLLITASFIQEGVSFYQRIDQGEISPARFLEEIRTAFPLLPELLERFGVDLESIRQKLAEAAVAASRLLAQKTLTAGQSTLTFIVNVVLMLYLTFFLLRDGHHLTELLVKALPLGDERERMLFKKFSEVIRATVKGNILVAMVQGALGGFIFWLLDIPSPLLWGVVMAFLSLIPAVGAGLVWLPVAIYLYAKGDWLSASVLMAYGALVIGLADNVLRPLLVGRDTKLPDYVVLFSTLGGISLMGINGFVIGPLIAALFMVFWGIFMREFNFTPDD